MGASQPSKHALVQAAEQLFAERGFAGAGTREIAAQAGVNQGLIRYHFGDKDGLWLHVCAAGFARLLTGLRALGNPARAPVELSAVLAAERPVLQLVLHEIGAGDTPRRRWLFGELQVLYRAARASLAAGGGRVPSDARLWSWLCAVVGFAAFAPAFAYVLGREQGDQDRRLHAQLIASWLSEQPGSPVGPWSIGGPRRRSGH
jgi:AcrR family transcriptional regulator